MAALKLSFEWEPAEGVSHPALARTWARLEIRIGERCVTSVFDRRTGGTRAGVYGPAFLLAEWIVRNFWFALSECAPSGSPGLAWLRRHSLVSAREGTSLPDLRFFRDEDKVIAEWRGDDQGVGRPILFVEAGRGELDPGGLRSALGNVVDLVLERLHGVAHPDVEALRADWEAIVSADSVDRVLCKRAAQAGLDAFDEDEVPEALARILTISADELPERTRDDLLDAAVAPSRLGSTLGAIADAVRGEGAVRPRVGGGAPKLDLDLPDVGGPPYERGYAFARALRRQAGQPEGGPLDLGPLLASLRWRSLHEREDGWRGLDRSVKGIVGISKDGAPHLVAPPRKPRQERFLVARSIYALIAGATATAPRLLTGAGTSFQAASRAFAAELLAPAGAIRARIPDGVDEDRLEDLADEFDVAPAVVSYQIDNQLSQRASPG
jgi:hypothetical protein